VVVELRETLPVRDDVELAAGGKLARIVVATGAHGAVYVLQAVVEFRRDQIGGTGEALRRVGAAALRHEVFDHAIERERVPIVRGRQLDEARLVMRGLIVQHEEDFAEAGLDPADVVGLRRLSDARPEWGGQQDANQEVTRHRCQGKGVGRTAGGAAALTRAAPWEATLRDGEWAEAGSSVQPENCPGSFRQGLSCPDPGVMFVR